MGQWARAPESLSEQAKRANTSRCSVPGPLGHRGSGAPAPRLQPHDPLVTVEHPHPDGALVGLARRVGQRADEPTPDGDEARDLDLPEQPPAAALQ